MGSSTCNSCDCQPVRRVARRAVRGVNIGATVKGESVTNEERAARGREVLDVFTLATYGGRTVAELPADDVFSATYDLIADLGHTLAAYAREHVAELPEGVSFDLDEAVDRALYHWREDLAEEAQPFDTGVTPYGVVRRREGGGLEITGTPGELTAWARRPGAWWPCSTLMRSGGVVIAELDASGDLVDLVADDEDIASDELTAWLDDVRAEANIDNEPLQVCRACGSDFPWREDADYCPSCARVNVGGNR